MKTTPVIEDAAPAHRAVLFTISLCLFLSGLVGIGYEVLFSRLLSNIFGDHFTVTAALLTAFLFGIALGSKEAFRFERHLWALQAVTALYAAALTLLSPSLEPLFFLLAPGASRGSVVLAVFAILLPPALVTGITLPVLAGCLRGSVPRRTFAASYLLYNCGAALTAFFAEFILIRHLGLRNALLVTALFNLAVAIMLFRWRRAFPGEMKRGAPVDYPPPVVISLFLVGTASALFQLLALKFASFVFGPFRESFAMVLTMTLLGLALGAAVSRFFKVGFLPFIVFNILWLASLFGLFLPVLELYATRYHTFGGSSVHLWKIAVLFLLMGAGSICFGAAIPALMKRESDVVRESGGLLWIAGMANVFGYLLMIFVIHPRLDYGQTILAISFLLAAAGALCALPDRKRAFLCLLLPALPLLSHRAFWSESLLYLDHTSFTSPAALRAGILDYQGSTVSRRLDETFAVNTSGGKNSFFINGYTSIELGNSAEYVVGVLSALASERLESALVLGLGSGATAGTVARLFPRLDVVEISPAVIEAQDLMKEYSFDIMSMDNVTVTGDDGLRFLKSAPRKYDLVLNTVTSPLYFTSGKLYTADFYRRVSEKLTAGGIYTTWLDSRVGDRGSQIILATLGGEFEYCRAAFVRGEYLLLVASHRPISLKQEERVFGNAALSDFFRRELARPIETTRHAYVSKDAYDCILEDVPVNTVDRPALEFAMAGPMRQELFTLTACIEETYPVEDISLGEAMYFLQGAPGADITRYIVGSFPDGDALADHMVEFYEETVRLHPTDRNRVKLAEWLREYGEDRRAEEVLRSLLRDSPDLYGIHYLLGSVLVELNRFDEGEEVLAAGLERGDRRVETLLLLGESAMQGGEFGEALAWFRRCLEGDPWNEEARSGAAEAEKRAEAAR